MSQRIITEQPSRSFRPYEPSSEKDYQLQLLRSAELIFPGYTVREWSPVIRDWTGRGAQPDLVLLSANHDSWWVVEVELASHSVNDHIAPQLETLRRGIYDESLVGSLERAFPEVSSQVLRQLVYREPGLLCIVNAFVDRILGTCRDNRFEMAVIEPYHCDLGEWAVAIKQMPSALVVMPSPNQFLLRRVKVWGDTVFLELPGHFPSWNGAVEVRTANHVSTCKILGASPRCLLVPSSMAPRGSQVQVTVVDALRQILRLEVM